MKNINKTIASVVSMAFLLSLISSPVLADTHGSVDVGVNANVNVGLGKDKKVEVGEKSESKSKIEIDDESDDSTSSTSTIKQDDDRLPPGIQHAPGIEKRIESGKDLPPGLLERILRFFGFGRDNNKDDENTPPKPDVIAPQIVAVNALNIQATSTHLRWVTNEVSTSKVWVATSTPVSLSGTSTASSLVLSFHHDLMVNGLATSTQYFYVVSSTDGAGNTSTSSVKSFTTLQ